jgi:hypothetical protein
MQLLALSRARAGGGAGRQGRRSWESPRGHNFAYGNRGLALTKGVQWPNEQPHGEDPQVAPARQEVLAHRDAL